MIYRLVIFIDKMNKSLVINKYKDTLLDQFISDILKR